MQMIEDGGSSVFEKSRRFYENYVSELIHERFAAYADRIAVGIAGEGSDCFGYDDLISRDHDFGTGVCLWVKDEDMGQFGYRLSIAYHELADRFADAYITDRIRRRRGVIGIHDFYSNILSIDCDTDSCTISESQWLSLDHSCLATATNGEVFRDDLGSFSAFRKLLLSYYPDRVWRIRIADELHKFAQCLQVNYARCMTRRDIVASELCRSRGTEAAMELFFLLKRVYPPYYKWTYRRMSELDDSGFCALVRKLAGTGVDFGPWENQSYHPERLNPADPIVEVTEKIAAGLVSMMAEMGLIHSADPYLERHVDAVLKA